jgi:hypothetical protein
MATIGVKASSAAIILIVVPGGSGQRQTAFSP